MSSTTSLPPEPEQLKYLGYQQLAQKQLKGPCSVSQASLRPMKASNSRQTLHKELAKFTTRNPPQLALKNRQSKSQLPLTAKKKKPVKRKKSPPISKTVKRWYNQQLTGEQLNADILAQEPKFRKKYKASIYTLQRAALTIQHWFFKKKKFESRIKNVTYQPVLPIPMLKQVESKIVAQNTFNQPSQIIFVQANATIEIQQIQQLVNNALQNATGQFTPQVKSRTDSLGAKNLYKSQFFSRKGSLLQDQVQLPPAMMDRIMTPQRDNLLPEWKMLHKKTVPRPLKKYVPSVTLSKPKSNYTKKTSDYNLKNQSKKEEEIQQKQSNQSILNAVTASFKIKTDDAGKKIFQSKRKSLTYQKLKSSVISNKSIEKVPQPKPVSFVQSVSPMQTDIKKKRVATITLKDIEMKYKQASKNFTHSSYLKTVVTPKLTHPMPKVSVSKQKNVIIKSDDTKIIKSPQNEQKRRQDELTQKMLNLRSEVQALIDQQKQLRSQQQHEYQYINSYEKLKNENKKVLGLLDKPAIREITSYKTVNKQLEAAFQLLCILLDTESWNQEREDLLADVEYISQIKKKILNSTQMPLLKRMEAYISESISKQKLTYLEKILEQIQIELVRRASQAMGQVVTWAKGIIEQRKLQFELEPIAEQSICRAKILDQLPQKIQTKTQELWQVERELFGENVQYSMVPKENADLFDEIYDINNIQLVPLKDQSENLNTEEVNERFDADLIGLEFARDNLKMSKSSFSRPKTAQEISHSSQDLKLDHTLNLVSGELQSEIEFVAAYQTENTLSTQDRHNMIENDNSLVKEM